MTKLVFVDLETTGLDYAKDEPWMIHAVIAEQGDTKALDSFTRSITHNETLMGKLPEKFQKVHEEHYPRYVERESWDCGDEFGIWLDSYGLEKKIFIAANPTFDATFIMNTMLSQEDFYGLFDYHLVDIEAYALGYLHAQYAPVGLPYKSDELSRALGVFDENSHKHDAVSDVEWMILMWKEMHGGKY